jgi:ribosomal protein S18 acetylase RimI-like enzyme
MAVVMAIRPRDAIFSDLLEPLRRELAGYRIAELTPDDGEQLQALFERNPGYFRDVFGSSPGPAEAQSTYSGLPEGKEYADKFLVGCFTENDVLVAALDMTRNYPVEGTWTIGLIFIDESLRRTGLATRLLEGLESGIRAQGGRVLRVGVAFQNERALNFWLNRGFEEKRRIQVRMGSRENALITLEKTLKT